MSLQLKSGRSLIFNKLAGAFFAVFALLVQPLVTLNIPSAFAVATNVVNETFDGFTGANAPAGWAMSGTGSYASATSCGNDGNCIKFDHVTTAASATVTLPLASGQRAQNLSFYLGQVDAGDSSTSTLTIEQFDNSTSLGVSTYTTSQSNIPLNTAATKIVFSTSASMGKNLALDDVIVTAESAPVAEQNAVCASGCEWTTLNAAVAGEAAGSTIELKEASSVTEMVKVTKPLTVNGNGYTVYSGYNYVSNSNNAAIGIINASNVTINNLIVDGSSTIGLHGINVYQSNNVLLNNVTSRNNSKSGVSINASGVTLTNISTVNNGWHGVNADKEGTTLTVNGAGTHTESFADIYVDDDTKSVIVDAPAYAWERSGILGRENDRVYRIKVVEACNASTFDAVALGSVNGQSGWISNGPIDQEVVENIYGLSALGCKTLRISNSVTSNGFGNQTFSAPADAKAGENEVRDLYEASFTFGTAKQTYQAGLNLSVSPDDGMGNRLSYVGLSEVADGTQLTFYDTDAAGRFTATPLSVAPRGQVHTIKFEIEFKAGESNDTAKVYLNDTLLHEGGSWEQYYRYSSEQAGSGNVVPGVDRLIIRAAGTAQLHNSGSGYLFDNVSVITTASDSIAPVVTFQLPINGKIVAGDVHTRSRVANETGGLRYRTTYIDNSIFKQENDSTSRNSEIKFDSKSHPDGQHTIRVVAEDYAGNTGEASQTFVIDNTKPAVKVNLNRSSFINTGEAVGKVQNPEIEAHDTNLDRIELWKNGVKTGHTWTANNTKRLANISFLGEGNYTIKAFDKAGNESDGFDFLMDNTKPNEFTISSPATGQKLAPNFSVNGTVSDADSGIVSVRYKVRTTDSNGATTPGGAVVPWTNASYDSALGEWTFDLDSLTTGYYRINVQAFDKAGNYKARHINVYVDANAPVIEVAPAARNADGTYTISGSISEAVHALAIAINDGAYQPASVDRTLWTFTTDVLLDGLYTFDIRATDTVGNISSTSGQFDAGTPPSAPISPTPNPIGPFNPGTLPLLPQAEPVSATNSASNTPVSGVTFVPSVNRGVTDADTGPDNNGSVLGASNEQKDIAKSTPVAVVEPSEEGWRMFGIAWYWWAVIIGAIGTAGWFGAGWFRGRGQV